jgi:hypothetical protein
VSQQSGKAALPARVMDLQSSRPDKVVLSATGLCHPKPVTKLVQRRERVLEFGKGSRPLLRGYVQEQLGHPDRGIVGLAPHDPADDPAIMPKVVAAGSIAPGFAMPFRAKRASHIDPPASSGAIMRKACPYRGENPGSGKAVHGELDPGPELENSQGQRRLLSAAAQRSAHPSNS